MQQLLVIVILGLFLPQGSKASEFSASGNFSDDSHHTREVRQNRPCTYDYEFSNVGQWAWLKSENYPDSYPNYLNCRYSFKSPRGTQMTFECAKNDFNVEDSQNCQYDRFYWSLNGDPQFRDYQHACGNRQISPQRSIDNKLELGFRSDESNPPNIKFQYKCQVKVVPAPCSCGVSGASSKIVGGTEAKIAEFPWKVALYNLVVGVFCVGTLISPNWVLTAAHCVHNNAETIYADIGDHDYTIDNEVTNQIIQVDHIIENDRYNPKTQENDIALLHLKTPATLRYNIQPACLPWKFTSRTFDGETVTAAGWGTDSFGGTRSTYLKKVDLDAIGTQKCQKIYNNTKVKVADTMFCAARDGKDTCQSDSGGSLDFRDVSTGSWYAIGIVSSGVGCAEPGKPGIYTQMIYFLGWIEQNSGETYCKA